MLPRLRSLTIISNSGRFEGILSGKRPYLNWMEQNTNTARVIDKSMPEGMNLRVLISLEIKDKDNRAVRQIRDIKAVLGSNVKSHAPSKTRMPLPKPMMKEILLPFFKPRNPPKTRNRPYVIKTISLVILFCR